MFCSATQLPRLRKCWGGKDHETICCKLLVLLRPGFRTEKHEHVVIYHFKTLEIKNCNNHPLVLVRLILNWFLFSTCPFLISASSLTCALLHHFSVLLPSSHVLFVYTFGPSPSFSLFWLCFDSSLLVWHLCGLSLHWLTPWLDLEILLIRNYEY